MIKVVRLWYLLGIRTIKSTGPVKKLAPVGDWFNVLDPKFNLHLNEQSIATTWVTKKPTVDGIVSFRVI